MNTPDSISVIIPVYNAGAALERCLDSVLRQNAPGREIIVVDDGSTDGSTAGLEARPGIRLLRHPRRRGRSAARNTGAREARGDILFFTDGDVLLGPDVLEKTARYLASYPAVDALNGVYTAAPPPPANLPTRYKNFLVHWQVSNSPRDRATALGTSCAAVRRRTFLASGGFDPAVRATEDWQYGFRLAALGYRIHNCPEIQVAHLKRFGFLSLLRHDLMERSIPMTGFLLRRGGLFRGTCASTGPRGKLSVVLSCSSAALLAAGVLAPSALAGGAFGLGALFALNLPMLRRMRQLFGTRFVIAALPLFAVDNLNRGLGFLLGCLAAAVGPRSTEA